MSVPALCTDAASQLYASPKKQMLSDALSSTCKVTFGLLKEFETLLEGIINYQVKQGHFKKKYDIPWETASEYSSVHGARYDCIHSVYSAQKDRAAAVETLCSVTKILATAYEALPSNYLETWHATVKQLDALAHDKRVAVIVQEYMCTLPRDQRKFLQKGIAKNISGYRDAVEHLGEAHRLTSNPLFEFFNRLLAYEGIPKLYNEEKRAKVAEALCGMTRLLSDVYEAVTSRCVDLWQATLKQWDALKLNTRIDALAQAYLDTLPKDGYDFAKENIETSLIVCGEALADLQEAHRETPQPLFEFFTKLLAIGIHFFERVRYFLQSLIDKREDRYWDEHPNTV